MIEGCGHLRVYHFNGMPPVERYELSTEPCVYCRIASLQAEVAHRSRTSAGLQVRAERFEAALQSIRDFAPVVNGDYAVMEAIPAMRKIAITALGSAPSGGTGK